jgi:hypothetical protein
MCDNTFTHFKLFDNMIEDYCQEINHNQIAFYDFISKFNIIAEELPKIEELFFKVKEMRLGLEKMYKLIKN